MLVFAFLLAACGGETPAPAPQAPVVAAPTPPPAPVAVGPDGPESIPVPAGLAKTTAELAQDPETIKKGEELFVAKGCGACHQFGAKLVGPDLVGVGDRRTPPWIARMILHPEVMIKEDPVAKQLFAEMMTPMANQGVLEADVPALISYLVSKKGP